MSGVLVIGCGVCLLPGMRQPVLPGVPGEHRLLPRRGGFPFALTGNSCWSGGYGQGAQPL
jgi:hypothetical protein